jgi:sporulation protein YlmC with PRC-barrel domain
LYLEDVRDIRGTKVRGANGETLGQVEGVIFDHDTMEICYLVVDGSNWLESGTFLLSADRVFFAVSFRRCDHREHDQ